MGKGAAVTTIDLETLGMTQEDLQQRVVSAMCERLMSVVVVDENGEYPDDSPLKRRLDKSVREQIDKAIDSLAEKHVLPLVSGRIETLIIQKTNQYGEATGAPATFTEFLVKRAENYLTEQVDWNGKEKGRDSYSWKGEQTRITFLVHQHLHHHIEQAMKKAMENANSVIVDGINATVKLKLAEIANKLELKVKTA